MPKSKREKPREVEEEEEDQPERKPSARGPAAPRLSITIPPKTRKKIRLAAALRDMEDAEWCRVVLVTAARRTVEKNFPGLIS